MISMAGSGAALADPGLGLNYAMVVHGEQRFPIRRPLTAGDVVTAQVTLTDIRDAGRNVMLTTQHRHHDRRLASWSAPPCPPSSSAAPEAEQRGFAA